MEADKYSSKAIISSISLMPSCLIIQIVEGFDFYRLRDGDRVVVQLKVDDEMIETKPGNWLHGKRNCDPVWEGESGFIRCPLTEEYLRYLHSHPLVTLRVVTTNAETAKSALIGIVNLNIKCILTGSSADMLERFALQDCEDKLSLKIHCSIVSGTIESEGSIPAPAPVLKHSNFVIPTSAEAIPMMPVAPSKQQPAARGHFYDLSITVMDATNLHRIPGQGALVAGGHEYWFSYQVFGILIQSDVFRSLGRPKFPSIRDSFKLMGTLEDAASFFNSLHPLEVHLCTDGKILATASISFRGLLGDIETALTCGDANIFAESRLEGEFILAASHQDPETLRLGISPSIRIGLELRQEGKVPISNLDKATSELKPVPGGPSPMSREAKEEMVLQSETLRHTSGPADAVEAVPSRPAASESAKSESSDLLIVISSVEMDAVERDEEIDIRSDGIFFRCCTERNLKYEPLVKDDVETTVKEVAGDEKSSFIHVTPVFPVGDYGEMEAKKLKESFTIVSYSPSTESLRLVVEALSSRKLRGAHIILATAVLKLEIPATTLSKSPIGISVELLDDSGIPIGVVRFIVQIAGAKLESLHAGVRSAKLADIHADAMDSVDESMHASLVPDAFKPSEVFGDDRGHAFRFSIDLRSICELGSTSHIYLKYSFPYFGSKAPVNTRPPAIVSRHVETLIPHGFCMTEFGMSGSLLGHLLSSKPLPVELWRKNQYKNDEQLGMATVNLDHLLSVKPFYRCCGRNCHKTFPSVHQWRKHSEVHTRRLAGGRKPTIGAGGMTPVKYVTLWTFDGYVPVLCLQGESEIKKVAEIRIVLILEDCGLTTKPEAVISKDDVYAMEVRETGAAPILLATPSAPSTLPSATPIEITLVEGAVLPSKVASPESKLIVPTAATEAASFNRAKATAEWEAWRLEEESRWRRSLNLERDRVLDKLKSEAESKEAERSETMKKALLKYSKLEGTLRKSLAEIESRERVLEAAETKMKQDAASRLTDLQSLQRRLRDEMTHKVDIEKSKCEFMAKRIEELEILLKDAQSKVRAVEDEYMNFRKECRETPEAKLQSTIVTLQAQKAELEHLVERERAVAISERQSKESVKLQLLRLARELQRLRRDKNAEAQKELDTLRLEYSAREERFKLDGDRQELRNIKTELEQLRLAHVTDTHTPGANSPIIDSSYHDAGGSSPSSSKAYPVHTKLSKSDERGGRKGGGGSAEAAAEVRRLEQELHDLLSSGAYDRDHALVKQLQKHLDIARETERRTLYTSI